MIPTASSVLHSVICLLFSQNTDDQRWGKLLLKVMRYLQYCVTP